mgnify:CR=1 FL=1
MKGRCLFDVSIFISLNHIVHFLTDDVAGNGDDAFAADGNDGQGQIVFAAVKVEAFRSIGSDVAGKVEAGAGVFEADDVVIVTSQSADRFRFDAAAGTARLRCR